MAYLKYFLVLILILPTRSTLTQEQNEKYPYRPREDRMEGITTLQDISDDNLSLISMRGLVSSILSDLPKDHLKVGFYLEKRQKLEIAVTEPSKYYKMLIDNRNFEAGFISYEWPSRIPDEHKIPINDLFAVTQVQKPGKRVVIPCVVYKDRFNGEIQGYQITLWARKNVDVEIEIVYSSGRRVWSFSRRDLSAYKAYDIRWNAKDSNGIRISPGNYVMNIRAAFHEYGEPTDPISFVYHFEHRWEFSLN